VGFAQKLSNDPFSNILVLQPPQIAF